MNKPENKYTKSKPQSFFNRVSSFFGNDKNINELKIEPNLNDEENFLQNKELSKVDINSDTALARCKHKAITKK